MSTTTREAWIVEHGRHDHWVQDGVGYRTQAEGEAALKAAREAPHTGRYRLSHVQQTTTRTIIDDIAETPGQGGYVPALYKEDLAQRRDDYGVPILAVGDLRYRLGPGRGCTHVRSGNGDVYRVAGLNKASVKLTPGQPKTRLDFQFVESIGHIEEGS